MLLFLKIELAVASALAMLAGLFFYGFISPFLPKHDDILDLDLEEEEDEAVVSLRHLYCFANLQIPIETAVC